MARCSRSPPADTASRPARPAQRPAAHVCYLLLAARIRKERSLRCAAHCSSNETLLEWRDQRQEIRDACRRLVHVAPAGALPAHVHTQVPLRRRGVRRDAHRRPQRPAHSVQAAPGHSGNFRYCS